MKSMKDVISLYKEVDPKTIKSGTINIRENIGDISPLVRKILARLEMKKSGIAVPLMVTPIDDPDYDFEVIDGERRLQSALEVGLPTVPIVIEKDSGVSKEPLSWDSFDANDTRLSNNWYEVGKFFNNCNKEGESYAKIAERAGIAKGSAQQYITAFKTLSPYVRTYEIESVMTARTILEKGNPSDYQRIIDRIVIDKLSWRDTEKLLGIVAKIREMIATWIDANVSAKVSTMIEPIIYEKTDLTVDGVKELLLRESGVLLEKVPMIKQATQLVSKMRDFNAKYPEYAKYETWEDGVNYYYKVEIKVAKVDFEKVGFINED